MTTGSKPGQLHDALDFVLRTGTKLALFVYTLDVTTRQRYQYRQLYRPSQSVLQRPRPSGPLGGPEKNGLI